MKPSNTRPPYLLPDNMPVSCDFMVRADAPVFWERCETPATENLGRRDMGEAVRFLQWFEDHPRAIITLYPGMYLYLCDTHLHHIREMM